MLMDKTGLRRGKPEKAGVSKKKSGSKALTEEQQREKAIQMALRFGIGYDQYKKEVDDIRAERIRQRLEQSPAIVQDNIGG